MVSLAPFLPTSIQHGGSIELKRPDKTSPSVFITLRDVLLVNLIVPDVTAAMLRKRTIEGNRRQNLRNIFLLFGQQHSSVIT